MLHNVIPCKYFHSVKLSAQLVFVYLYDTYFFRMFPISDEQGKRQRLSDCIPVSEQDDSDTEVHITPPPSPLEESSDDAGKTEILGLSIS
jgi:hypothetical protein